MHFYTSNMLRHIAFLKVHKAGSSTMQNIFFRFGLKYNLNVFVPNTGNFLRSRYQIIPLKGNDHYDIIACHTYYKNFRLFNILPSDAVKIGIVREPLSRMISSAYFYRDMSRFPYLVRVPDSKFINNLVNYPERFERKYFSFTRNAMARDFSFPYYQPSDKAHIQKYLNKLNEEILLVLVLERFNESLVLMKRILNWRLTDIIYLASNTHEHEQVFLNETEVANFKMTNFLDFEIYQYFLKVLESKLQQVSKGFNEEVTFFKIVLEKVSFFCTDYHQTERQTLVIEGFDRGDDIIVSETDCKLMQRSEQHFISSLRKNLLRLQR
ncbi:galactose-3-O-sulfotransferase 2-like isoform X2 [Mercenaria mercenaria]|nr:galactose-3-O-sulfotransferase 2-like isoform X2 [Mercenaria mercenaria]